MSADSAAAAARHLMLACYDGVLATVSHAVDGYPFGSVVPYCLDRLGRPVILIASIAQHTRNITHDARVSLTIFDRREADLQDAGRVTYLGDARRIDDESERKAASSRYFRYFPVARGYDFVSSADSATSTGLSRDRRRRRIRSTAAPNAALSST
jgi:putative heme iron utilization protein